MPGRELEQLQRVNRFLKLSVNIESELEQILGEIAMICQVPAVSIVFNDHVVNSAHYRTSFTGSFPDADFCSRHLNGPELVVVKHVARDARFKHFPWVSGMPHIRFYAGMPLIDSDGKRLGTISMYDMLSRDLDKLQREILQTIAIHIVHLLEFSGSIELLRNQYVSSRETEIKLRSFFESSASCHLLLDRDMNILSFNRKMGDLIANALDIRLSEGKPVATYGHPVFQRDFEKCCQDALAGKETIIERGFDFNAGEVIWHMAFAPALDQEGTVIGVSFNAADITELIKQEKIVHEQNQSLISIEKIELEELQEPAGAIVQLMEEIMQKPSIPENEYIGLLHQTVDELKVKMHEKFVNYAVTGAGETESSQPFFEAEDQPA